MPARRAETAAAMIVYLMSLRVHVIVDRPQDFCMHAHQAKSYGPGSDG